MISKNEVDYHNDLIKMTFHYPKSDEALDQNPWRLLVVGISVRCQCFGEVLDVELAPDLINIDRVCSQSVN